LPQRVLCSQSGSGTCLTSRWQVGLGYGTYKGLQEGKAAGAQGAQCTRRVSLCV